MDGDSAVYSLPQRFRYLTVPFVVFTELYIQDASLYTEGKDSTVTMHAFITHLYCITKRADLVSVHPYTIQSERLMYTPYMNSNVIVSLLIL